LYEEAISLFLIDEKWLFLVISFKGDIFTEIGHFFDMFHPELVDCCQIDFSLKMVEVSVLE
jgi:hypothetical protein